MSFAGTWDQNARCVRSEADRQLLRRLAGTDGGPIVALQHYLLHPFISEDKCPYMITNYDQIVRDYAARGMSKSCVWSLNQAASFLRPSTN